jgi:hypothetical protein
MPSHCLPILAASGPGGVGLNPAGLLADLFPLLYGACFLVLLWQAFRVMGRGFSAVRGVDQPDASAGAVSPSGGDRTGRITIHPELLDAEGRLTEEDLLTVRFSGDNESPSPPPEGSTGSGPATE